VETFLCHQPRVGSRVLIGKGLEYKLAVMRERVQICTRENVMQGSELYNNFMKFLYVLLKY